MGGLSLVETWTPCTRGQNVFSIVDLNSAFHKVVCDEGRLSPPIARLHSFPNGRTQGANANPSSCVKVINRVGNGLECVLAYLDLF